MAGPVAGLSTAQAAQQKLQEQANPKVKDGASKFDGVMNEKAQQAHGPDAAKAPTATQTVQGARMTQNVNALHAVEKLMKADRASMQKMVTRPRKGESATATPNSVAQADSPIGNGMVRILSEIERGEGVMDKLINEGLAGKEFSMSELLALQAGMYKYSQELELTGKVVEKATNGLKDTLKTQV